MERTDTRRVVAAGGAVTALVAVLLIGSGTAGASEDRDDKAAGAGRGDRAVQVVWNSSDGRTASVECPEGTIAVGGGVEGPTNSAASPVMGTPLPFPGRSQNPWLASSVPTGPGIPGPNQDFDFGTGEFATPTGTAAAPTGWFGQTTNTPGGTRVYAVCMES